MPGSASSTHRPEGLINRLHSAAADGGEAKLKVLRELKNQIIGNRTKKLSYIKLGAVPSVVSILSTASFSSDCLLVQCAATIGSFACGVDSGVKAVLDAGAFPLLINLLSHSNEKLQVLNNISDALSHTSTDVRVAACVCLKNISRSVKYLSAGHFMTEAIIKPLIQLLCDTSTSVQIAALRTISNLVVDFTMHKSLFVQSGGVKQLVELSESMDSTVRLNAVWALRNLMFLVDSRCKEGILMELRALTLSSLVCDPSAFVQEQALALVCNLVNGHADSIEHVFTDDGSLLNAVGRQLWSASKPEVLVQGMCVLCNVASGKEFHKEAVMQQLLPQPSNNDTQSIMVTMLQSDVARLRTAAVWTIVNLTIATGAGALARVVKLRNAGIVSQLKNMVNDPCLDVKLRVRTALGQTMTFGDFST